jgi:hypothetical protein
MKLKIICSWCQKFMGTKKCESRSLEGLDITHSICPECKEKVMREIDEDFAQNPNNQNQKPLERRM